MHALEIRHWVVLNQPESSHEGKGDGKGRAYGQGKDRAIFRAGPGQSEGRARAAPGHRCTTGP